jgi:hypothetical protein
MVSRSGHHALVLSEQKHHHSVPIVFILIDVVSSLITFLYFNTLVIGSKNYKALSDRDSSCGSHLHSPTTLIRLIAVDDMMRMCNTPTVRVRML